MGKTQLSPGKGRLSHLAVPAAVNSNAVLPASAGESLELAEVHIRVRWTCFACRKLRFPLTFSQCSSSPLWQEDPKLSEVPEVAPSPSS